jgi:hypothetical protein
MRLPLQIVTSHTISLPLELEAKIRRKAAHLGSFYKRVKSCRIVVDGPVRHHRLGSFGVRIDLDVPGERLVVSHKEGESLSIVIRDAFSAAVRQLENFAHIKRHDVKRSRSAAAVAPPQ